MSLVDTLIQSGWLKTPHIIEAFRAIKRQDFMPEDSKDLAELNEALPIGWGQTISQPLVVAFMIEKLQPQAGDKILDIGSGSGWTTALLAYCISQEGNPKSQAPNQSTQNHLSARPSTKQNVLCSGPKSFDPEGLRTEGQIQNSLRAEASGPRAKSQIPNSKIIAPTPTPTPTPTPLGRGKKQGKVIAIEIVSQLKEFGECNVAKYNFIDKGIAQFICADGSKGYSKEAPYDKILCSAEAKELPPAWKEQLKKGGRIVTPIGNSIYVFRKKSEQDFEKEVYPGFVFVPLVKN